MKTAASTYHEGIKEGKYKVNGSQGGEEEEEDDGKRIRDDCDGGLR